MSPWYTLLACCLVLCAAGCNKPKPAEERLSADDPRLPTRAQPKLPTIKLWLGNEELIAEQALNGEQQMTGMMFRTNMAENEAMIFPMAWTRRASFWMKNCPMSLSAAYIDPEGIIQEIHELQANNTNAVESATENIRFVLETRQGWFERHHVGVGTAVRTERGSLMETFFPHE